MPIPPALPVGGLAGFRFLDRTFERQLDSFSRSPDIEREIEYFRANAGTITSTEDLLADRRLLRVALGAFGLEDQVDKTAFVRKIIQDGTRDPAALANRLADKSWARFSEAVGFGNLGGSFAATSTREAFVERFRLRQFESALGEIDFNVAQAVAFRRQITEVAAKPTVDRTGWFEIMGNLELRRVVEGAFGLPSSFGALDIDAQRNELEERASRIFGAGSAVIFQDPEVTDQILSRFLLRVEAQGGPSAATPGATALTLLQSSGLGDGARANLFASLF